MNTMTLQDELRIKLTRIQEAKQECLTHSGYVKTSHRYRYQILTRKESEFKGVIEWMENVTI